MKKLIIRRSGSGHNPNSISRDEMVQASRQGMMMLHALHPKIVFYELTINAVLTAFAFCAGMSTFPALTQGINMDPLHRSSADESLGFCRDTVESIFNQIKDGETGMAFLSDLFVSLAIHAFSDTRINEEIEGIVLYQDDGEIRVTGKIPAKKRKTALEPA